MASHIGRRKFLATLLGGAAAWPPAARALEPTMPGIGFLNSASTDGYAPFLAAFRRSLNQVGYVEGQNVAIEYRWAEGNYERLPELAADLVRRKIVVMAATTTPAALAAKAATSTIPIVFTTTVDPVLTGLVDRLNRPTSNATGVYFLIAALEAKRAELAHELMPKATIIAMLINPDFPSSETQSQEMQQAAHSLGLELHILKAGTESGLDAAFEALVREDVGVLVVASDAFFFSKREQLVSLAARHAIPAIYFEREFVSTGGLASYSPDAGEGYRQAGNYVGRILGGEKPADLPVVQPTKFELVINLRTSKALGLQIPDKLLAIAADQFITLLRGAAAWPLAARAQQKLPTIGYLGTAAAAAWAPAQVPRLRLSADPCCPGGGHQYRRARRLAQFATAGPVVSLVERAPSLSGPILPSRPRGRGSRRVVLNGHTQLPKIILGYKVHRWNRGCQIASSNRCQEF